MMDLKNGILEINGFILSKNSKTSDFDGLTAENVEIKVSKRGNTYIRFLRPVQSNGIDVFVEVSFYKDSELPEIELWPAVPSELTGKYEEIARYKVRAAKQWLKGLIDSEPTTDCAEGISYHFGCIHISSFVRQDIHYGLVGGEINLRFDSEV